MNHTRHEIKLKPVKDDADNKRSGLWIGDIVMLENVGDGWECRSPMRRIGRSNYFEFRPVEMGGKFMIIGTYRTKDNCCVIAERLKAGTHVLRGQYENSLGTAPLAVVLWAEVIDEIAQTA